MRTRNTRTSRSSSSGVSTPICTGSTDPTRTGRAAIALVFVLVSVATLLATMPAMAAQTWRNKRVFFGDAHWHSCLSQDADRETSLTNQYESMLQDYGLDFSLESDHAEGASAGIYECLPYLAKKPTGNPKVPFRPHTGEEIADAMKAAADDWNGQQATTPAGPITFVTFPGYEWAPDARCWQASPTVPFPNDFNSDDNTPGHINYFFDGTTGWSYHDDVWEPGDGDSQTCATASALGLTYYTGSKDWVDEILGQLVHQRDDPNRSYDLLIQYNHPAATIDKGGTSDHLAKWNDFEHSGGTCSVGTGGEPCSENQCEAMRRAYGVTGVEWYAEQEASIGSTQLHDGGLPCTGNPIVDALSPLCFHQKHHVPERYVTSRGLREGYMLAEMGGSDTHSGRRFSPKGFPGSRGAGSRALTVVYADDATRPAIWDGLNRRHSYALSRFRGIGPVHKGRVDFFTPDPLVNAPPNARPLPGDNGIPRVEHGMGELVEASFVGTPRDFTIAAAAEQGTTGVVPVELRLYRVNPSTALSSATNQGNFWLDDVPGDPGKFGELLGTFLNTTGSATLTHTFTNVVVRPGDAVFAVVPYSDYTWVDDFYDLSREPLDADGDGAVDPGKRGFAHTDNQTIARTTPIFFQAAQERSRPTGSCSAFVSFIGSGSATTEADGGVDAGRQGDGGVLPVAVPGGVDVEWNRYRFALTAPAEYVDLSFYTAKDEDDIGHLFAVRIDGQLVYSGRAGIDHDADVLVDKTGIPFKLKAGLHDLQIHMDDQEFATGDDDPDFHCNDYDGPLAFIDAIAFHANAAGTCDLPAPTSTPDVFPTPTPVPTSAGPTTTPIPIATPFPSTIDAFHCFAVETAAKLTPVTGIELDDPLDAVTVDARKLQDLCAPTSTSDSTLLDAATHLVRYQVKAAKGQPKLTLASGLELENALGTVTLDVAGRGLLALPSAMTLAAPAPSAPEFDAHEVDRFSCYKAKIAKGAATLPKTLEVTIADQLTAPPVRFAVKKVLRLCVPTAKDGDAVKHADHLVCYEAAPTKGRCAGDAPLNAGAGCKKEEDCGGTKGTTTLCAKQAKFAKVPGVLTSDDFRISTLDLAKNTEVCLPSRRVP